MSDDATKAMPEAGTGTSADLGAAMRSFVEGKEAPSTTSRETFESDAGPRGTSDLESLIDSESKEFTPGSDDVTNTDTDSDSEVGPESTEEPTDISDVPEVELKVKGFKEPQKVKLDPNDENLKSLLNKGIRFEKKMAETAEQRRALEKRLNELQDYESKAEIADKVAAAQKLAEQGYHEHALATIMGESANSLIDTLVEERIKYQNASPEERLQIDLDRQKRQEELQRQRDADRIAKLEAQINSRSEQVREAEYTGYLEDAKSRYDLSQWVDDSDVADSLNDMLNSTAMSDILKLQRQREARGEPNITQRDIRRAYAKRAKQLIQHQERQSSKIADEKVSKQAETAAKNAKVASTKNYEQSDVMSQWQKSGGTMSDLVDMFRRTGKGRGPI